MGDPRIFKMQNHTEGKRLAAARKRVRADQLEVLADGAMEAGREERFDEIMDRVDELREQANLMEK